MPIRIDNGGNNKYGARKTIVDGIVFDSKREAERYGELKLLLRAGKIHQLTLQPVFVLCCDIKYIADFKYLDLEGNKVVVEDVKSPATAKTCCYRLKKKMFLELHCSSPHVEFKEIF